MSKLNDKQNEAKKELRCDPKQLVFLNRCLEKGEDGIAEWNQWRKENPAQEIWLQGAELSYVHLEGANLLNAHLEEADLWGTLLEGANLGGVHLEGARLMEAHLEGANLSHTHLERTKLWGTYLERAKLFHTHLEGAQLIGGAHLEGANVVEAHLEGANLSGAHLEGAGFGRSHLEGADFRVCSVDGLTLFIKCCVNYKTDFRGVGLDSCRIDEPTKYLLEYNRRRMNCEDWYKEHPRLAWPVKAFFWMSDYGNSTWRIIKTFFFIAICFAIAYYIWGAVDYYLLGITDHPGIVANLFIDKQRPIICWLVLLRSIYFSIVTMTTLGFGDMYANAHNYWFAAACGHLLLGLQVLLGYCLLGALITRFAVLFKSGVIPGEFQEKQKEA